jgi:hypothetical protein
MIKQKDSITYETAKMYANKVINGNNDLIRDNRGKYQRNSIFDFYPDLREHVHEYCVTRASEKNASFKINDILVASKKIYGRKPSTFK